ncbi:hypothetical protein QL285_083601 [Trifolium repens]|nr:hypothetical protein QL285_083601 [Trifolium repens]
MFIPSVCGSILTEGKNSTNKRDREDREVAVPGGPKAQAVTSPNTILSISGCLAKSKCEPLQYVFYPNVSISEAYKLEVLRHLKVIWVFHFYDR